jgi:hypothetical protein
MKDREYLHPLLCQKAPRVLEATSYYINENEEMDGVEAGDGKSGHDFLL